MSHYSKLVKNLSTVVKGAGLMLFVTIISYLLQLVFKVFGAPYLGKEAFGLYEMTVTISSVIGVLSQFGLPTLIKTFIPRLKKQQDFGKLKGIYYFTWGIVICLSITYSVLLYSFADLVASLLGLEIFFANLLKTFSFFIPFKQFSDIIASYFYAEKKFFLAKFPSQGLEQLFLVFSLFYIIWTNRGILELVLLLGISYLLVFLFYLYFYLQDIDCPCDQNAVFRASTWLAFSAPLAFNAVVSFGLKWTDNFVIASFLSSGELGIYAISFSLANYLLIYVGLLTNILLPLFSEQHREDRHILFEKVRSWVFAITLFTGLILIFFPRSILNILFGHEFISGWPSLVILSFFMILTAYFKLSHLFIIVEGKTKILLYVFSCFAILNIGLSVLLVQIYGITGVALATGFSLFMLALTEHRYVYHNFIKFQFDWNILKFIATGLASIVITRILARILLPIFSDIIVGIGAIFLYTALFVFGVLVGGVFDKTDIELILLVEKKLGINLAFVKTLLKKII